MSAKSVNVHESYVLLNVQFDVPAVVVAGFASQFWIAQESDNDGFEFDVDLDALLEIRPLDDSACSVSLPIVHSQAALEIFNDQTYASADQCNSLFGLHHLAQREPSAIE